MRPRITKQIPHPANTFNFLGTFPLAAKLAIAEELSTEETESPNYLLGLTGSMDSLIDSFNGLDIL